MNKNIEKKLSLFEKIEKKVENGEKVTCPVCGQLLIYISPWEKSKWATEEQKKWHPGIYCPVDIRHFTIIQDYEPIKPPFNLSIVPGEQYLKVGCVNLTIKTTKGTLKIDNIQKIDLEIDRLYYKIKKDEKIIIKFIDLNKILSVENNNIPAF